MGKPTTRKKHKNGGEERARKPASGFAVFEVDFPTKEPRGAALARFATRAEAEAFVKGLNFHDPRTLYAIEAG
jgi:hypothetical protein